MVEASDQSPAARQSFGEAYCMQSRSLRRRKQGSLREWENSQSLGRPFVTRARKAALDFVRVEPPDYAFGVGDLSEPLLPSVPALAEVLSERFAYQSAVESHDAEATRSQGEGDRLDRLEASLKKRCKKALPPPLAMEARQSESLHLLEANVDQPDQDKDKALM